MKYFLKTAIFYCFLLALNPIFPQTSIESEIKTIPNFKAERISIDALGNIYLVRDVLIHKYNSDGEFLYSYSDFSNGSISSIDVNNPMKIMVFYKETGILQLLNDRLTPIGDKIDLLSKSLSAISLACYTLNNMIWLYDYANMELISMDIYYNITNKILYNFSDFQPSQLFEISNKMIAIHNPGLGVYFFDSFGSYTKNIAIMSECDIQIIGHNIYYIKDNTLCIYNYQELKEHTLPLRVENAIQCLVFRNKVFILNKEGVVSFYDL